MGQRLAQILADLAAHACGILDHAIKRPVLGDPLGCCLRPALGHPRYVVDGVAGQGEKINNALRWHTELFDDALAVHRRARHRVDQNDM